MRAVKNVQKEYGKFVVMVEEAKDRQGQTRLEIRVSLRDGCEWKDAWEEAWALAESPNLHCLSDNALRLYLWAKGPKNTGKATDRRKIGAQARLRGTYLHMEEHFKEIRLKADPGIRWEDEGKRWHEHLRVWFEAGNPVYYHHGPLNPALGLDVSEVGHKELERFRKWLYAEIAKPRFPDGTEVVGILDIRDRRTLNSVFSKLPTDCGSYGPLPEFFKAVRVVDGMEIRHWFEDGGEGWLVVCRVLEGMNWKEIKAKLAARESEIPLEKRYRLSKDGLALLKWILDLRSDECLQGMTPVVEDCLEKDIGIETEWNEKNVRTYVELLLEEINEKTEFNLRAVGWHDYSEEKTRILVRKKRSGVDEVVRAVQGLALAENKVLAGDKVREHILSLIHEG